MICSIRDSGPIVCSNYDPVLTMAYFRQGQILQLRLLYRKMIAFQCGHSDVTLCVACFGTGFCIVLPYVCLDDFMYYVFL